MINVMTYDLYGSWFNKIGHHSALFHRSGETGMERELNTVCLKEKKIRFGVCILE
jgi:GH18 family chitinase